jgi:ubiquitin C-terminal hydrolase
LINKVRNELTYNTKYTLTSSFKLLTEKLWPNDYINNQKKSYSPYEFKAKISVMNELFRGIAANDSKDLVNFIIMTLHEELNLVKNKIDDTNINLDQRNMPLMYNTFTQNFNANNQSVISKLFYAFNYNMTECHNCHTPSYNFQTYFFLIFPLEEIRKYKLSLNQMNNFNNIIDNNVVNIYDCLDYERKITVMDGTNMMYCNYCRLTCKSIMSTNLCTGPEILIIILNRGKGIQFDVKINFYEQLDLSQYIYMKDTGCYYNLIGVITHIGQNGMGGHFIAYCKNPIFNTWNKYNDSIVSPVNNFKSDVIDFAMPYLLFYQKYHP